MDRRDVSFTFLNRVEEIERNVEDRRWQSALALALTLPDICGGIAFPDIVKQYRNGRTKLDKKKNPARDVGTQYIRWFDEYAGDFFKVSDDDPFPYICGERCWQLRCEYLHQNKGFLNEEDENATHFHLGVNCGTSVCQLEKTSRKNGITDIRIDIEQFCRRMCQAARNYYDAVYREMDFSLYNTPVLDFVQTKQGTRTNPLIVILCGNTTYANGLRLAISSVSDQILICPTPEHARKELGKRKPVIWIVTEEMTKQPDQPWCSGKNRPVILLMKNAGSSRPFEKNEGKLTVLTMPVQPEDLRNAVMAHLI